MGRRARSIPRAELYVLCNCSRKLAQLALTVHLHRGDAFKLAQLAVEACGDDDDSSLLDPDDDDDVSSTRRCAADEEKKLGRTCLEGKEIKANHPWAEQCQRPIHSLGPALALLSATGASSCRATLVLGWLTGAVASTVGC